MKQLKDKIAEMTEPQLAKAFLNLNCDIYCGECMCMFFTGMGAGAEHVCSTASPPATIHLVEDTK